MTPADLRALRLRLALTQAQLALALGIARSTICDYESVGRKRSRPIPRVVQLACRALELVVHPARA